MPPNTYIYVDGNTIVIPETPEDSRYLFHQYKLHQNNCYNKRNFVDGALYNNLCCNQEHVCILDPEPGKLMNILVYYKDEDNKIQVSGMKVFKETNPNHPYLIQCNELGKVLKQFNGNTCRKGRYDKGTMRVIGYGRKNDGSNGVYKLTEENHVKSCFLGLTECCKKYLDKRGFSDGVQDIIDNQETGLPYYSPFCGFPARVVQSENLINAAHFDCNDKSLSISTFTEECIGSNTGWYFILPNLTIDSDLQKGTAIKLSHGVTLMWDGCKIWHCSTVGTIEGNSSVFGTFYGA